MTIPLLFAGLLLFLPQGAPTGATELYYLAFLRPAPAASAIADPEIAHINADHLANARSMARRGVIAAAGPFDIPAHKIIGMIVFRVPSLDAARDLATADPLVRAHLATADVHPWRGPAALGAEYFRLHKEPTLLEGMGVHPVALLYRGPARAQRPELIDAHHDYLARLRREGKLATAGPFEGDPELVAIEVFERIPEDEARRLIEDDPAVKAGVLRPEIYRWHCAEHMLPGPAGQ